MSFENMFSQFDSFRAELPVFFNMCENIEDIKAFYTDLLGIKENAYQKNSFIGL